jgi:hypothetical protein
MGAAKKRSLKAKRTRIALKAKTLFNTLYYFEDFAIEDRPKMARRWDAKMGSYFCAVPKGKVNGVQSAPPMVLPHRHRLAQTPKLPTSPRLLRIRRFPRTLDGGLQYVVRPAKIR